MAELLVEHALELRKEGRIGHCRQVRALAPLGRFAVAAPVLGEYERARRLRAPIFGGGGSPPCGGQPTSSSHVENNEVLDPPLPQDGSPRPRPAHADYRLSTELPQSHQLLHRSGKKVPQLPPMSIPSCDLGVDAFFFSGELIHFGSGAFWTLFDHWVTFKKVTQ